MAWKPEDIPADIVPRFVELVTLTTRNLAMGERDERTLRKQVNEVAEEIVAWCEVYPERADGLGLEIIAQQLSMRLVYRQS